MEPETSRSKRKMQAGAGSCRRRPGWEGDVGEDMRELLTWGDLGAGSQLFQGRNCQDASPGDLNSPPCQGSQYDHICSGKKCVSGLSPPRPGARPEDGGRPHLGTQALTLSPAPKESQKVGKRESDCHLADGRNPHPPGFNRSPENQGPPPSPAPTSLCRPP